MHEFSHPQGRLLRRLLFWPKRQRVAMAMHRAKSDCCVQKFPHRQGGPRPKAVLPHQPIQLKTEATIKETWARSQQPAPYWYLQLAVRRHQRHRNALWIYIR